MHQSLDQPHMSVQTPLCYASPSFRLLNTNCPVFVLSCLEPHLPRCPFSRRCTNSIVKTHHQWWRLDLALCYCLQRRMSLALIVVILHVVKTRERRLCGQSVALASCIVDCRSSYASENVWFAVLSRDKLETLP